MSPAKADAPAAVWQHLPEPLKAKLRIGFSGKFHLLEIAGWCLRSGDTALQHLATDALHAAFGENPLDGGMASELLAIAQVRALLAPDTLAALAFLHENWRKPDNTSYFERLLARRDLSKIKRFVEQSAAKEPGNLFWLEKGIAFGLMDNDSEWVRSLMALDWPDQTETLLHPVRARLARMEGDPRQAAVHMDKTAALLGEARARCNAAFLHMEAGQDDLGELPDAVTHAPWDVNTVLRAHDLLTGRNNDIALPDGRVAILLYSWNNCDELSETLASLAASDLGDSSLFVLDNGSNDGTGALLGEWQARFDQQLGANRFHVTSLPVNIGAPAARNWLMNMDAVREHDFICYLDDDVELSPNWLGRLGAATQAYPNAGVWGCRVVDHANPALVQCADFHLRVEGDPAPMDFAATAPNPFRFSDLHIQTMDMGQLDYLRPCASVTGCCHLFRTDSLLKAGPFSIFLSPSQYDDMEHDLRRLVAGSHAVYQGHLAVRHKKRTGAASRQTAAQEGNALGNKYKMQTMFEPQALRQAMAEEQAVLDRDLLLKLDVLA